MDLEQRVKALEQEVQILKNEIQATLLAMQEQMLNQTYPTLSGTVPEPEKHQVPQEPAPAHNGHQQAEEAPVVRKVSLEDVPQRPSQQATQRRRHEPHPSDAWSEETQIHDPFDMRWATQPQLEEWARKAMKKYGVARTRQMIETRMAQGKMDAEARDLLLDYVARVEDMQQASAKNKKKKNKKAAPPPAKPQPQEEDAPAHQSMVLRLIAGVANASIGVKRDNG